MDQSTVTWLEAVLDRYLSTDRAFKRDTTLETQRAVDAVANWANPVGGPRIARRQVAEILPHLLICRGFEQHDASAMQGAVWKKYRDRTSRVSDPSESG